MTTSPMLITDAVPNMARVSDDRLPTLVLDRWSTPRTKKEFMTLEDVRDRVHAAFEREAPIDLPWRLSRLVADFQPRTPMIHRLTEGGLSGGLHTTRHGLRMLARDVLPSRGLDTLLPLAESERGAKLANMAWSEFATRHGQTTRMLRTAKLDGARYWLRAVTSTDYTVYDDRHLLDDLLDAGWGQYPVLAFRRTDRSMMLRLALDPDTTRDGMMHKAVPIVQWGNSEVQASSIWARGGMWRQICTNGMGTWEDDCVWRWRHTGDRQRIRDGVAAVHEDVLTSASGVVQAYERALDVAIDDAYAWFEAQIGKNMSNAEKDATKEALHDPTTTPGGTLASVVDAVTLMAQSANDEFRQDDLEQLGASLLRRGLAQSLKTDGVLRAPVEV